MRKLLSLLLISIFLTSCAGRLPTPEKAQKVIKKYFHKYGKKYPDTIYKSAIKQVDVFSREEIHFKLVSVDALISFDSGASQKVEATLERKAGSWKVFSWEASN